jgi:hypothetical protein
MGATAWDVQAICGDPAQVSDTVEIVLKPVYDPQGHVAGHLPVGVPKQVWTYDFGSSRLMYILTFLEQTTSEHHLPPWGMKPTVLDQRNLLDLHTLTRTY